MYKFSEYIFMASAGECQIKDGSSLLTNGQNILAANPRTLETAICFCASLSNFPRVDCFYLHSDFHKRDILCGYQAYRSNKLCHRYSSLPSRILMDILHQGSISLCGFSFLTFQLLKLGFLLPISLSFMLPIKLLP